MTYNVELTDKPDKRGFHHVMIRLHKKGSLPARIQTELEIEHRYVSAKLKWGKWVKSSYPFADKLNTSIIAEHDKVKGTIQAFPDGEKLTPAQAKQRYESTALTQVRQFSPDELVDSSRSFITNKAIKTYWKAFVRWAGEELTIEQITPRMIENYVKKLQADGLKNSTINAYIGDIREMYTAIQEARGLAKREILAGSPFLEWKNLKVAKSKKGRLHEAGIRKMVETPFDLSLRKTSKTSRSKIDHWARWCWLASQYQAGMRIGDLIRSRYEWYERDTDGFPVRLNYQMQKNGKLLSIPLSSAAKAHLAMIWDVNAPGERYLLPYLDNKAPYAVYRTYEQMRSMPDAAAGALESRIKSTVHSLNRGLKKAVIDLNLQVIGGAKLTNHSARHSFADKVRLSIKNGKMDAKGRPVTNFDAKDLLGHSFMSTTEMYFGDMDQEMLDSAMDAIMGDE